MSNPHQAQADNDVVAAVISDYARSWSLLQAYDEQSLSDVDNKQQHMFSLELDQVVSALAQLKRVLMEKGEATELFAQLRGNGLASAIGTIEQGFGEEWFYPNVASRAAHLLYFVIKNHPLADGNKRSGAWLFVDFLHRNGRLLNAQGEAVINDTGLAALTLLVAESDPKQKETLIRLMMNMLAR